MQPCFYMVSLHGINRIHDPQRPCSARFSQVDPYRNLFKYPLLTNISIENGPFIVDLRIKVVIFHSYVSLPEGSTLFSQ